MVSCPQLITLKYLQGYGSNILSVVTSLNDVFDATDEKYKVQITSLNKEADGLYASASQSLQV